MVLFSFKEGNLELFWLNYIEMRKKFKFYIKTKQKKGDLCWFMIKDF